MNTIENIRSVRSKLINEFNDLMDSLLQLLTPEEMECYMNEYFAKLKRKAVTTKIIQNSIRDFHFTKMNNEKPVVPVCNFRCNVNHKDHNRYNINGRNVAEQNERINHNYFNCNNKQTRINEFCENSISKRKHQINNQFDIVTSIKHIDTPLSINSASCLNRNLTENSLQYDYSDDDRPVEESNGDLFNSQMNENEVLHNSNENDISLDNNKKNSSIKNCERENCNNQKLLQTQNSKSVIKLENWTMKINNKSDGLILVGTITNDDENTQLHVSSVVIAVKKDLIVTESNSYELIGNSTLEGIPPVLVTKYMCNNKFPRYWRKLLAEWISLTSVSVNNTASFIKIDKCTTEDVTNEDEETPSISTQRNRRRRNLKINKCAIEDVSKEDESSQERLIRFSPKTDRLTTKDVQKVNLSPVGKKASAKQHNVRSSVAKVTRVHNKKITSKESADISDKTGNRKERKPDNYKKNLDSRDTAKKPQKRKSEDNKKKLQPSKKPRVQAVNKKEKDVAQPSSPNCSLPNEKNKAKSANKLSKENRKISIEVQTEQNNCFEEWNLFDELSVINAVDVNKFAENDEMDGLSRQSSTSLTNRCVTPVSIDQISTASSPCTRNNTFSDNSFNISDLKKKIKRRLRKPLRECQIIDGGKQKKKNVKKSKKPLSQPVASSRQFFPILPRRQNLSMSIIGNQESMINSTQFSETSEYIRFN